MQIVIDKANPDILIPSEGTYPYVQGGVSSWIAQLIKGLPQYSFGIVFIGSKQEEYPTKPLYELPDNLVYMAETFIFDEVEKPKIEPTDGDKESFKYIEELYIWFKDRKDEKYFPEKIKDLNFYLNNIDESVFLYSRESWNFILKKNQENAPDIPFIDYFWAIRNIHMPIWKLAKLAKFIGKRGSIIHSPSTGYAGFLATLVSHDRGLPYILTEHGIYTKERKIDLISNSSMIEKKLKLFQESAEHNRVQKIWVNFFEAIGLMSYSSANHIFSLFNVARDTQIGYGAIPEKCKVIPNGVDVAKLESTLPSRSDEIPKVITLIGRVVSIKDIKTFIRAVRITANEIPEIEAWIVGPDNEEEGYAKECRELISILDLEETIKFLGFQNIMEILPKSGLQTLTSISEGMPLVVLEGFAAGVPCVSTDVGSCRELIYGKSEEDKAIGKAGRICSIAKPKELAEAYIELFSNDALWYEAQKSALERVKKYYTQEDFLLEYQRVYEGIYHQERLKGVES
jgi:glycosyltransferase involved in cell wall biosynthesis